MADPKPRPPTDDAAAAKTDFSRDMSYGDYLHLDEVLGAQQRRSGAHDEMLFIVQHQVSELWMKLLLHELEAAIAAVSADELHRAFKMLARVSKIMEQLVHAWDVLATMTPPEYSAMRPSLASSSGFQSWQYRMIEFRLGNKNAEMLKPHAHRADLLARVQAALHVVYRDPEAYWDLYQLGEELMDLEDTFRLWRFRHVTTVERVIGFKRGTGGTSGVSYLRKMLDVVLFPEIWKLRTDL